jgi:uncharacterized membrane protein SpoIIM required for sporulation
VKLDARSTRDREAFVADRRARWDRLDGLVARQPTPAAEWAELATLYRSLCADLSRGRSLLLTGDVLTALEQLAARAHNALYGARQAERAGFLRLVASDFPRELRACGRFFALAAVLFYGPFALGFVAATIDPAYASGILPESQLVDMEKMYSGEIARESWQDASMAGFYVMNNVGIAFRCFATGALAGLGSLWFLAYNGLVIGTVFGYLIAVGDGGNLLAFTAGHSAWELTGIVVSGTAGLRMGWALVDTGGLSRLGSLRAAGPSVYRLIAGASAMLFVAAAIEGFWSAGPVPVVGKGIFGLIQVAVVASWLTLGGRRADPR